MKLGPKISRVGEQSQTDEARLERLLEATNVVPWEADAQTWVFTYVGPQTKTLLGYSPEQWYEKDFWASHIHPEDREFALDFCQTSSKTLTDFEFEYRMIAADGRTVWLNDVVNVIVENGTPRLLRGFMKDITDRKRAEEALREGHEQLEVRVEERTKELRLTQSRLNEAQRMAKIGNWERNLATNELWLSGESCRFLGFNPHESSVPYETFLERVHPEDRQHLTDAVQHAVSKAGQYETEFRTVLPDGEVRVVHARAEVACDEKGRPTRIIGTAQDVTDQVELERQIVAAGENERNHIGQDLHDDIGQRLTGISLCLDALERDPTRDNSSHVDRLRDLASYTRETLEQVRFLAAGLSPIPDHPMGLTGALEDLARSVSKTLSVDCELQCSCHELVKDNFVANNTYRVAQEAIANAVKHGGAKRITIACGNDDGQFTLSIIDDGCGMDGPPDSGLGSRIMKYRARAMGGGLVIRAGDEGGTVVCLTYPIDS